MLMSERIAGRWGGEHGRCRISSFSSCRCILFVHKCLKNVITSLWAMRHYFPLTFAIYFFRASSFVSWAWLELHSLALPRAWPSPLLAAPVTATTRAEKKNQIKTPQGREAFSKAAPSLSHPLPRGKDPSLLDKREPCRKAKPGAQMTQTRKGSGGVAPTGATGPIAVTLVHRLSICPVPITSQNGLVPALLKDGTGGTKVWGIVSPVSWGRERASSKHPLLRLKLCEGSTALPASSQFIKSSWALELTEKEQPPSCDRSLRQGWVFHLPSLHFTHWVHWVQLHCPKHSFLPSPSFALRMHWAAPQGADGEVAHQG